MAASEVGETSTGSEKRMGSWETALRASSQEPSSGDLSCCPRLPRPRRLLSRSALQRLHKTSSLAYLFGSSTSRTQPPCCTHRSIPATRNPHAAAGQTQVQSSTQPSRLTSRNKKISGLDRQRILVGSIARQDPCHELPYLVVGTCSDEMTLNPVRGVACPMLVPAQPEFGYVVQLA